MATSRKANAQPRSEARKVSVKVRGHFVTGSGAHGNHRGPRFILIEAGLIVLVVSTAWAIASVSMWWVPVYLALLVMIFITPRVRQSSPSASELGATPDGAGIADVGEGLRVDRVDGAEQYRPIARSDADVITAESAESPDSNPDSTGAGRTKARRGRSRTRKISKPATELVPDSLPVAWIQVGPGKFVRIEGGIQAADSAQTGDVAPWDTPATEPTTEATPAAAEQPESLAIQEPFVSPETPPCDVEPVLVSTDCALGSVTEEHGIAPSTFSLPPQPSSLIEGLDGDAPVRVDEPEIETGVLASPVGQLLPSEGDPDQHWLQPGTSRNWVSRAHRGIVHAVPRVDRAFWRRNIRAFSDSRTSVGSWFAPNTPRRHAACRAFGRMAHVQRSPQPRSPPGRGG